MSFSHTVVSDLESISEDQILGKGRKGDGSSRGFVALRGWYGPCLIQVRV